MKWVLSTAHTALVALLVQIFGGPEWAAYVAGVASGQLMLVVFLLMDIEKELRGR